jgi:hypothetical protein
MEASSPSVGLGVKLRPKREAASRENGPSGTRVKGGREADMAWLRRG